MPVIVRKQNRSKKLRPCTRRAGAFLLPFSNPHFFHENNERVVCHCMGSILLTRYARIRFTSQRWEAVLLIFEQKHLTERFVMPA